MNCNDIKDKLFAYVEGLLEDSEKEAVASHLEACSACRDEAAEIEQLQERLVSDGSAFADSDLENAVVDRIVREQTFKLRKTERANYRIGVWRNIMNTKVTKFAAAAVIIIAVLVGYSLIPTSPGGVVWAEVAERVAKVKAFVWRAKIDMRGMEDLPEGKALELEIEAITAAHEGLSVNTYVDGKLESKTFAKLDEKALITLMPDEKKYMRLILTDEYFEKMREENGDPKKMVEQFLENEYTELGRSEIDGVVVEGVDSNYPGLAEGMLGGNLVGRLWVDVETGWPVQMTLEVYGSDGEVQMEMVMEDFEWDVEVDASEFAAEIPDDYELLLELDVGKMESGERTVEGLRFFAELTDGKYPSDLAMMTMNEEMMDAITAKMEAETGEEPGKPDYQRMVGLQMAGPFFAGLQNEGKEPAYYGETVTAADVDKVLLRWKLDDGNYRVIFGDLRIEDVSAARLAELEGE